MQSKVIFISPMYNATEHLPDLIESMKEQVNKNFKHILVDDMSTDGSFDLACELTRNDDRFQVRKNQEKCWALKNVVKVAREYQNDSSTILAVIDADDALCNENTVDIIIDAYKDPELDTAWTSHTWDINTVNTSRDIPQNINPYQIPWCTSHLKTWRATTMLGISDENFKDLDGEWFKRGCDQALYLPLLYLSHKRKFIDEICYLYRVNSKSTSLESQREIIKNQLNTIRLVRSRGFV